MKFAIIEPAAARWEVIEATTPQDLYARAGFDTNIDHGMIAPAGALPSGVGISIVVDGFSLFKPKEQQRYFAIGRQLYGGNAVLYGFDEHGETVDLKEMPVPVFMTLAGVEKAIEDGQIERPTSSFNGEKFWEWPQPNPYRVKQ
jgi:hypothetical protein